MAELLGKKERWTELLLPFRHDVTLDKQPRVGTNSLSEQTYYGAEYLQMELTSPCKRQQIPLRTNGGWPVSLTPCESPLGYLTCKGNEYFVDRVVPSHIEPFFLQSTLVTLDLSCMEVRVLGPAEVDWADNSQRMLSGEVTPRQLSFHTPCLSTTFQ